MKHCPVCGRPLEAKFVKGSATNRRGVMVFCAFDTRHFRAFLNDPEWCEKAKKFEDPMALVVQSARTL